jgi:hypothetical protein
LKRWAEAIAGELVQQRLAGEITWGDIIVLLCFLALTLFVHSVAAGFLRRKVRQADAATEEGTWRQSLWNTIGKPLYLLIWIYGAYFAAMPLLLKSGAAAESHAVRRFFDGAFHFGFFTAGGPCRSARCRRWTGARGSIGGGRRPAIADRPRHLGGR